jgi:hypothetical protein
VRRAGRLDRARGGEELLEQHAHLSLGEMRAQAVVRTAAAERDVGIRVAGDVEAVSSSRATRRTRSIVETAQNPGSPTDSRTPGVSGWRQTGASRRNRANSACGKPARKSERSERSMSSRLMPTILLGPAQRRAAQNHFAIPV